MKQTRSLFLPTLFTSLLVPTSLAYKWPNPQIDETDHQLYDASGYKGNPIFGFGVPVCSSSFAATSGRQPAAEWLRTAFHDAATHDAAAGTGGMDGSIAVEGDRAENGGAAINSTVGFFLNFVTENLSLADLLAIGARTAVDACGGPEIPIRAGRVDNLTPGPFGVPKPDEDLQSHIASFSKMGFNKEEMIGLVACGHSIGGVHAASFPEIVPTSTISDTNQLGIVHFDSTFGAYDNTVAKEFVDGVRNNPLAFGANDTTNSDFRIFSSDGNVTISSFASSQDTYFATCGPLLGRMVDMVPAGVTLTDVINPVPVKPRIFLDLQQDGSLSLTGEARFFNMQTNANRVVKFVWQDRNGACSQGTCSVTATHDDSHVTTTKRNQQALWYDYSATIDSTASISKFWFEIDEGDGSGSKQVNSENGSPFPVEDRLFILPSRLCQQFNNDGTQNVTLGFAIRSGSQVVDPKVVGASFVQSGQAYTRTEISAPATLASNSTTPNYQLWMANAQASGNFQFDIVAQLDGQQVKDAGWSNSDINDTPFQCSS